MVNILIGIAGALIIHIVDIVSLKKIPLLKPLIWIIGIGMGLYSIISLCLSPDKLSLPVWSTICGWVLLAVSVSIFLSALFINLPFRKTYIETGVGDKLIKTGLYSLARHPGAMWFILFMASLVLVSQSRLMLVAAPIFMVMNTLLVIIQDKVFFTKMFAGYDQYQKETPMLLPNRRSINAFFGSLRRPKTKSGLQGGKPNDYAG
jgi:protein-S-isoprenylcysteine O-methyltransferase Ste14